MKFSLVVPCFNESESLGLLLEALRPFLISKFGESWEVIFVDDGSRDSTRDVIIKAHEADLRVKGLYLSRNFGHQPAIFSGLVYAVGDHVGVMDADMQDPPEVLLECFTKACEEKLDIVYAVRKSRKSSLTLKFCYWCFYRLMRLLSSHPWPLDAGDFSVMSKRAVHAVLEDLESSIQKKLICLVTLD